VLAGDHRLNDTCDMATNRLQMGSYQFYSDCDYQTFCDPATNRCEKRGCRRDDFPFGYPQFDQDIPDKCPRGQFCPDEEDKCQSWLPVGSPCQLNRDGTFLRHTNLHLDFYFENGPIDQCMAPPNFKELDDKTNRGYNFNGSVCLNNVCM
jgi:hypothetical protein